MYLGFGGLQNVKFCKYGNVGHLFSLQKTLRLIFLEHTLKNLRSWQEMDFLPSVSCSEVPQHRTSAINISHLSAN